MTLSLKQIYCTYIHHFFHSLYKKCACFLLVYCEYRIHRFLFCENLLGNDPDSDSHEIQQNVTACTQLGPGHIGPPPKTEKEGKTLYISDITTSYFNNTASLARTEFCVYCVLFSDDCQREEE